MIKYFYSTHWWTLTGTGFVVLFYGISTFGLVWFGFMAHQPLLVTNVNSTFIHINSSISNNSVLHKYTVWMSNNSLYHTKTVLFQIFQFSTRTQFKSTWPLDKTLSRLTRPGQCDGNEEVLRISQNSSITGTSLSDCLVPYPGHSWEGSCTSAEKESVYSTAPPKWAT